jgi:tetrahydromethanopterin S-methyltransferase subunit E
MIIALQIVICLLNAALAFFNYNNKSYFVAMFNAFACGLAFGAAIFLAVNN